jgi:hypothetical protein
VFLLAADVTEEPVADEALVLVAIAELVAVPALAVPDKVQHPVAVEPCEEQFPEQEILRELSVDKMRQKEDVEVPEDLEPAHSVAEVVKTLVQHEVVPGEDLPAEALAAEECLADAAVANRCRTRMQPMFLRTGPKVISMFVWPTTCVRPSRNGLSHLSQMQEAILARRISKSLSPAQTELWL